jgi:hypothetical protein
MEANMNKRAEIVKAMDNLVRCINCEDYIDKWLILGVADGDIKSDTTLDEIVEMGYCDDVTFKSLMTVFLQCMSKAGNNGGLYCDGVVSGEKHIEWR